MPVNEFLAIFSFGFVTGAVIVVKILVSIDKIKEEKR